MLPVRLMDADEKRPTLAETMAYLKRLQRQQRGAITVTHTGKAMARALKGAAV